MGKTLLITRPEHDPTTRYFSKWSEEIIQEGEKKGVNVIDLRRDKANRSRVVGTLEKTNPRLVVLNGHGSEDCVGGHNNDVILKVDDDKAVKDKIIYARSCKSAKNLGLKTIANGARAYLGYIKDFVFTYDPKKISKPLEDEGAALFLKPSNHIPLSLLKSHTVEEANEKSKELFRKNIEKLMIEGPVSENYSAIAFLYWDMINQVCLGDKTAVFA